MKTVCDVLAESIEVWLDSKSSRSLNLLAKMSGVSYATVRRIATRENTASAETAASISYITMSKSEARDMFSEYFPQLVGILDALGGIRSGSDVFDSFFTSKNHFPIILLAKAKDGIDEELVASKLGKKYLCYFQELVDCEVLSFKDSRYHLSDDPTYFSQPIAREHIQAMLDISHNCNDVIPSASSTLTFWENLNKEGIQEVKKRVLEFRSGLLEIIAKEEYQGDILWYSGWMSNVLHNEDKLK